MRVSHDVRFRRSSFVHHRWMFLDQRRLNVIRLRFLTLLSHLHALTFRHFRLLRLLDQLHFDCFDFSLVKLLDQSRMEVIHF